MSERSAYREVGLTATASRKPAPKPRRAPAVPLPSGREIERLRGRGHRFTAWGRACRHCGARSGIAFGKPCPGERTAR